MQGHSLSCDFWYNYQSVIIMYHGASFINTVPSVNTTLIRDFAISNLVSETNLTCGYEQLTIKHSSMPAHTHVKATNYTAAPEIKARSNVVPIFICSCHSNSCGYPFQYYVHPAMYIPNFIRE
jgi:hypothetical protein